MNDVVKRPEIDMSKITLSNHYMRRIKERLPHIKDPRSYTVEAIVKGRYNGITTDKDKNSYCHCFSYGDELLFLSVDDMKTMVTIYEPCETSLSIPSDTDYQKSFNLRIKGFYDTEIRKLDRKLNSLKKKLEEYKHVSDVECSQLQLRKYKTRSKNVKLECEAKITNIRLQLNTYEKEIDEIEKCKLKVIKASSSLDKFIISN